MQLEVYLVLCPHRRSTERNPSGGYSSLKTPAESSKPSAWNQLPTSWFPCWFLLFPHLLWKSQSFSLPLSPFPSFFFFFDASAHWHFVVYLDRLPRDSDTCHFSEACMLSTAQGVERSDKLPTCHVTCLLFRVGVSLSSGLVFAQARVSFPMEFLPAPWYWYINPFL